MPTELKSDTARVNGAKSNGPITEEGKAISARNSLRHGLTAKAVVLPTESREDYQALLAAHVERFQPADPVEMDLVESMAASRWRLRRVANIETHLLTNQMTWNADNNSSYKELEDDDQRLAYVFHLRAEQIALLARYENSLNRAFDRALKQLQLLQRTRVPPPLGSFRPLPPDPLPLALPPPRRPRIFCVRAGLALLSHAR